MSTIRAKVSDSHLHVRVKSCGMTPASTSAPPTLEPISLEPISLEPTLPDVHLVTLGSHQLLVNGEPVRLDAGRARTCEVIAFMLEFGPAQIIDLREGIFPDRLPVLARDYFHQIRKAVHKAIPGLKFPFDPAFRLYTVDSSEVRLRWDVQEVRDALALGGEVGRQRARALFSGSFMPGSELLWVQELRDELKWAGLEP